METLISSWSRAGNRGDGGDGASPADRGAGRDQEGRLAGHLKQTAEEQDQAAWRSVMLIAVYTKPERPACTTCVKFMPNPRATTRRLQQHAWPANWLSMRKGCSTVRAEGDSARQGYRRRDNPAGRRVRRQTKKIVLL